MADKPVVANWFVKEPEKHGKAQRRFFELHFLPLSAEVRYFTDIKFDGETRSARGKGQKGAIPIFHGSVVLFNSEEPVLAICNPTRTWRLTAEDNDLAVQWGKTVDDPTNHRLCQLLQRVVHDAKAMEAGNPDPGTRFVEAIPEPTEEAPVAPTEEAPQPPVAEGGMGSVEITALDA